MNCLCFAHLFESQTRAREFDDLHLVKRLDSSKLILFSRFHHPPAQNAKHTLALVIFYSRLAEINQQINRLCCPKPIKITTVTAL